MRRARNGRLHLEPDDHEEMSLQITSMADIFTIILVFLLKSFSTGMTTLAPPQNMKLPTLSAKGENSLQEALKVEFSDKKISIDGRWIDIAGAEDIPAHVAQHLQKKKSKYRDIASDGKMLTLLADVAVPYAQLKLVMQGAALAGYLSIQLVAVRPE